MSPAEFSLRLQKGIAGGFAPPTPSAILTVTGTPDKSDLAITAAFRPDGTPTLQDALPKSLSKSNPGVDALVSELHDILKSLPTEQPPGSEDIYGLDTSIAFGSADLEWCNGGPQGCGGGKSFVQASDEQKTKFRRAVDIVNQLVGEAK
ncbi:hypothetical protein BDY19DRAFT_942315 [Irpex rosettiformis]|uniref:Uncharacterized protein n=1 Tax=Irpex rosettiformis TaxID=378272 RepID=A0ACB8U637_9APHY|nr:hypothetical protein BDY19DRAFT_942315 [Irpex rosettiformis]